MKSQVAEVSTFVMVDIRIEVFDEEVARHLVLGLDKGFDERR